MAKFCTSCGSQVEDSFSNCPNCGAALGQPQQPQMNNFQQPNNGQQMYNQSPYGQQQQFADPNAKSKIAAGLLGIFLGAWGIHNFYLGNTGKGAIQIVVTLVTCGIGGLWGFIEGIMILTGSINTDAQGRPLKD